MSPKPPAPLSLAPPVILLRGLVLLVVVLLVLVLVLVLGPVMVLLGLVLVLVVVQLLLLLLEVVLVLRRSFAIQGSPHTRTRPQATITTKKIGVL
jgi:hypothetical protein